MLCSRNLLGIPLRKLGEDVKVGEEVVTYMDVAAVVAIKHWQHGWILSNTAKQLLNGRLTGCIVGHWNRIELCASCNGVQISAINALIPEVVLKPSVKLLQLCHDVSSSQLAIRL